jgi:signal transduction histidine kinase
MAKTLAAGNWHPAPAAVQVSAEIPADLPAAHVDAQQTGMVLGNLVTNAYQAMPEGGRLTLSAGAEEETVVLSIAVTGRGIPPEAHGQVL